MIFVEYTVSSTDTNTTPVLTGGSNFTYVRTTNSDGTIKVVCSCDTLPTGVKFNNAANLLSIDYICTDSITTLYQAFYNCTNLHTINMDYCNVESVTTMQAMCHGCAGLKNFMCHGWNAKVLTNMATAFYKCTSLEYLDLSGVNTEIVNNMNEMCSGCSSLKSANLSGIKFSTSTSTSTNMNGVFKNDKSLVHVNFRGVRFSPSCNFASLFTGSGIEYIDLRECSAGAINTIFSILPAKSSSNYGVIFTEGNDASTTINNSAALSKFYHVTGLGKPSVIYEMTDTTEILPTVDSGYKYNKNPDSSGTIICIYGDTLPTTLNFMNKTTLKSILYLDPSNLTTAQNMFNGCTSLVRVNSKNWDFSKSTSMNQIFTKCTSLTELDTRGWKTPNVTILANAFSGCTALTKIIGIGDINTSNVTTLSNVFSGDKALVNVDGISKWDVSKVTNFGFAFANTALTKLDLSGWKTLAATNMSFMFNAMEKVVELIFDTATVSYNCNIAYMFQLCTKLTTLDISNLRISNTNNNANMFNYANSLTYIGMVYCDASSISLVGERLLTGNATKNRMIYIPKSEKNRCQDSDYISHIVSSVDIKISDSLNKVGDYIDRLYWDETSSSYKIDRNVEKHYLKDLDWTLYTYQSTLRPNHSQFVVTLAKRVEGVDCITDYERIYTRTDDMTDEGLYYESSWQSTKIFISIANSKLSSISVDGFEATLGDSYILMPAVSATTENTNITNKVYIPTHNPYMKVYTNGYENVPSTMKIGIPITE